VNTDGTNRAIDLTSAAFHAGGCIDDPGAVFDQSKYLMRANIDAHSTPVAFLVI
jgi:hypothetical protein